MRLEAFTSAHHNSGLAPGKLPSLDKIQCTPGLLDPELNNGQAKVYSGRIEYVPVSTANNDFAGILLSDKKKAYLSKSIARSTLSLGNIRTTDPAN